MKLSQKQLEWIVSEVVRRLQASGSSSTTNQTPTANQPSSSLSLAERLVTTETLRDKLNGVKQVNVITKAIVTPAVIDLLRDQKITLVRGTAN